MRIRPEQPGDEAAIRAVNVSAFAGSVEADIVDALRTGAKPVISLVAEEDREIIGHILFTPVLLAGHPDLALMGLGPMAIEPKRQRRGVGTALVRRGLELCQARGSVAVVVLGHPEYYPRFGFVTAARYGISCEYDALEEAFMVVELRPGALRGISGMVAYDEVFDQFEGETGS